ncbi:MAG: SPOR domain-containing protein, partial [Pseudomonadales bacterium]
MKTGFFLLLLLILVVGCASRESVETSGARSQEESVYAQSLPATDMDASRANGSSDSNSSSRSRERTYARELTLEEEMIVPRSSVPAPALEDEALSEVEPISPASAIDLYNTFTLQLVAMGSMDDAIAYARQYDIDPEKAGVARILSHGKIYYVLAYGIYSNERLAEEASQELQQLGIPEPWIRRLG